MLTYSGNLRYMTGVMLISLGSLTLEMMLIRVFDVLFSPASSYLIVSCAIYSLGISGVWVYLKQSKFIDNYELYAYKLAKYYAISVIFIMPCMNIISIIYRNSFNNQYIQVLLYIAIYFVIAFPFYLVGMLLAIVFSASHDKFNLFYFFDLLGASVGCVVLVLIFPSLGPGGLLLLIASFGLLASGLFSISDSKWSIFSSFGALALICMVIFLPTNLLDFHYFDNKRGALIAREIGATEKVLWDPVSKIEVINQKNADYGSIVKHIAYDGGNQSSFIYPFNGDYEALKERLPASVMDDFWQRGVLASHFIKEGGNNKVLIIGSAGGQETKAALLYGAKQVDAVEMVSAVVGLGKNDYADYNGGIFNDPRVMLHVEEGRAFLRKSRNKYDIIQIFSNHTSSSIASGAGIISPVYLQTVEAYKEYFDHLSPDGILHINHHLYPRMVTIAARAWKELGRNDFQDHVVIFERIRKDQPDTLPTFLIKMTPWSVGELAKLETFYGIPSNEVWKYRLVANPIDHDSGKNFLNKDFYTGSIPRNLEEVVPYNIHPSTDDRPFFNFFRKDLQRVEEKPGNFYCFETAGMIGNTRFMFLPSDLKNIVLMFLASLVVGSTCLILLTQNMTQINVKLSYDEICYFSFVGAGFIIIEFVMIQSFIKIIGNPLYSFTSVIFTLLFSAGFGSLASEIIVKNRMIIKTIPFVGILLSGGVLYLLNVYFSQRLLGMDLFFRVVLSSLALFPLGFFLGMPMPLGIKEICAQGGRKVPLAWAINGFFTIFGGFVAIMLSLLFGFRVAIITAFCCYVFAFVCLCVMNVRVKDIGNKLVKGHG